MSIDQLPHDLRGATLSGFDLRDKDLTEYQLDGVTFLKCAFDSDVGMPATITGSTDEFPAITEIISDSNALRVDTDNFSVIIKNLCPDYACTVSLICPVNEKPHIHAAHIRRIDESSWLILYHDDEINMDVGYFEYLSLLENGKITKIYEHEIRSSEPTGYESDDIILLPGQIEDIINNVTIHHILGAWVTERVWQGIVEERVECLGRREAVFYRS